MFENEYFECQCNTDEHMLKFTYDPMDGELHTSVYLWKWPFWKRVWIGLKYIFGYTSQFGDFDSGPIVKDEDLERLETVARVARMRKEETRSNDCEPNFLGRGI